MNPSSLLYPDCRCHKLRAGTGSSCFHILRHLHPGGHRGRAGGLSHPCGRQRGPQLCNKTKLADHRVERRAQCQAGGNARLEGKKVESA
eukprot:scaffold96215_cov33-Prasinocladus_malaysianus.AAC.1